MAGHSLVGDVLIFDVSDPWELAAQPGVPGRRARVVQERCGASGADDDALLLELENPIRFRGLEYQMVVATARRAESLIDSLRGGRSCEASLCGLPPANPPDDPLTVDWWRGGLAMNVVVRLLGGGRG